MLTSRSFASTLTIALHIAIVVLVLLPTLRNLPRSEGKQAPPVMFQTRAVADTALSASIVTAAAARAGQARASVRSAVPAAETLKVIDVVKSLPVGTDGSAIGAAAADPFSSPAVVSAGSTGSSPSIGVSASTIDEISGLLADLVGRTDCARLMASFVATVQGDGHLSDVRFIGGSLGPELGERLAHALEAKVILAASANGSSRRTIIGPVPLDPQGQGRSTARRAEQEQCQG